MTKPLSKTARQALRSICREPIPCQSINSGVVWKLLREDLAEIVNLPSPFRTDRGAFIQHLRATRAGASLIGVPTPAATGFERKWLQCGKCNRIGYYDFQPFSLSNPIIGDMPCGHARSDATEVTAAKAIQVIIAAKQTT